MIGNNSKVVLAAFMAIVAMFIFMPVQHYVGAGSYGLEYRFIWNIGIFDDGRALYQPHVALLAVEIASVVAITGLKIAAK